VVGNLIPGSEVLHSLERAFRDAQMRSEDVRANLHRLDEIVQGVVQQRGHALLDLARHYLPDLSGDTVSTQFVEVRSHLEQLLQKKQRHEAKLQSLWDANLDRRSQLEQQVDESTNRLNDLATRRNQLQQSLANRLKEHAQFQVLSGHALIAENELKRNELRVAEMREEVAEKLPAYEQSRLFQYLYRRGYGTAEYKGRGLTKRLDRWVARLVKYNKNRQGYNFLRVTPELMVAEVERRRGEFTKLMEQIESIEDAISDEIGLTRVLDEGNRLGQQREEHLAELNRLENLRATIEADIAQLQASENEYYQAGVDRLKEFLGSLEESALEYRTRVTPQTTDDAVFVGIKDLNRELRNARIQSQGDRKILDDRQKVVSGLDELLRQFRSAEFDSRRSFFSPRLDVDVVITRYLRGQCSTQSLWGMLRQHQQFIRPEYDDSWDDMGGLFDSDVSHVLGRVLVEVAGEAMRQAARRGMYRRGPIRQQSRRAAGRPTYRRNGGFTSGQGF
jgi:hypothetical protein